MKDDYIIPEWLFDERKLIILRLPFSESNEKFAKSVTKSVLYLQIINVNSTLFGTPETLHQSLKLKIMLNTTAALFMKVTVLMVKTMLVNP